jgi:hypothetical protein
MGSPSKIAHFDIHGYGASGAFHVPSSAHTAPNRIAAGLEAYAMGISVDAGRHGQTPALPLAERAGFDKAYFMGVFRPFATRSPIFSPLVGLAEGVRFPLIRGNHLIVSEDIGLARLGASPPCSTRQRR